MRRKMIQRAMLRGASKVSKKYKRPPGILDPPNVRVWNKHRKQGRINKNIDLQGIDFSGKNLGGIDLSNLHLNGSCFKRCSLNSANFTMASLKNCDFQFAQLISATFIATHLEGTNFCHSNLQDTDFTSCDGLDWHNLAGANIYGSNIKSYLPDHMIHRLPRSPLNSHHKPNTSNGIQLRRLELTPSNEEFSNFRSWVLACLSPEASVEHNLMMPLIRDRETLLSRIDEMERQLPNPPISTEGFKIVQMRKRILKELRFRAKNSMPLPPSAIKLAWELLPPGENCFASIRTYFEEYSKKSQTPKLDLARIEKILSLRPEQIYIGQAEFDGYVVFCFTNVSFAVLDNPLFGNAIYLLHGDWQNLSKYHKMELLREHSQFVERIVHTDSWFDRLKTRLQI